MSGISKATVAPSAEAGLNMVQALNLALRRAMRDDESVLVFGEDVAVNGGVFRVSAGLLEDFGAARVRDTPLSEAVIGGLAVGAAAMGMRPVAEIQFMGFVYPAIDQLVNHASRLRNRTRGRLHCPMVLRAPYGGGIHAPEHHSESAEAMLAQVPGLRVVIPSSPSRAYGLLLAAVRDDDPVVFLEPKRIYRAAAEAVADDGAALPLDRCFTLREGRDLTLVGWGAMIPLLLEAASALASEGIDAEVIDVATLKPLDEQAIIDSVSRTGRLVVVHEAPRCAGFGAEIAALAAEKALMHLLAPVERVTGWDTVMPLPRLETRYMPDLERVLAAARRTMEYR